MSYKKPKIKPVYKLSEETKAYYRRQSALRGWETRRVNQSLKRITKELEAQFDISPYNTRKIIAAALQKPRVRNGWNDKTKPHKNATINKRNLEKNWISREFLAKEAKAAKPKGAGYYINRAFKESKRQATTFGLEKLNAINIRTKAGKQEYAMMFSQGELDVAEEKYEELQAASDPYQELTPEERGSLSWSDAYKAVRDGSANIPKKADGTNDWRQFWKDQAKLAAEEEVE